MIGFSEYIGSQFGNPRGFVGSCCCIVMNLINREMYRKIVSDVSLTEHSNTLDIGYGNGYLVKQLYKRYRPNIYGIDISDNMKAAAEKRNRRAAEDQKLHLDVGDCCRLAYDDDFFDAVTSVNTIYFWSDTLMGLREICRTLKPGAAFYNVVYTKEWLQKLSYTRTGFRFFKREDFVKLGKQAGFSEVSIQDIVKNKSYMVMFRK